MKFGIFFEMSTPRPFTAERRAAGVPQRARAGAPGRRARLRLGVGGRAPLPRGVLALLGARGRARGGRGADRAHPHRPRRRRLRARDEPPDPRRRALRHARHHLGRPARGRHRARRPRGPSSAASTPIPTTPRRRGTSSCGCCRRCGPTSTSSYDGNCFSMPERNVLPEAGAEAAPADVGHGHEPGHRARRRRPRARLPRRRRRRLRRAGAAHRRSTSAASSSCDPVGGVVTDEVTTLNFLYCHEDAGHRGRAWAWAWSAVRARQLAPAVDARGVPHAGLPVARQPRARGPIAAKSGGPGDAYGIPEGICVGDPDIIAAALKRWESLGVDRHQLPAERARDDPAAAGARQHAAVRPRGHAALRVACPAGGALMLTGTAPVDEFRRPRRDARRLRHRSGDAARRRSLPGDVRDAHRRTASRRCRRACIPPTRRRSSCSSGAAPRARGVRSRWRRRASARAAGCARAGIVQGCVCDNDEASAALRARWGFPVQRGHASRCAATTTPWKRSRPSTATSCSAIRGTRSGSARQRRRRVLVDGRARAHAARPAARADRVRRRGHARRTAAAPSRRVRRRRLRRAPQRRAVPPGVGVDRGRHDRRSTACASSAAPTSSPSPAPSPSTRLGASVVRGVYVTPQ